jgi:hypothetical protein
MLRSDNRRRVAGAMVRLGERPWHEKEQAGRRKGLLASPIVFFRRPRPGNGFRPAGVGVVPS